MLTRSIILREFHHIEFEGFQSERKFSGKLGLFDQLADLLADSGSESGFNILSVWYRSGEADF